MTSIESPTADAMVCLLCGGTDFEVVAPRLRHGVPRRVVRCAGCTLVSLEHPQVDIVDYETEYGEKHGPVLGHVSEPSELFQIYLPYMTERIQRLRHLLHPDSRVLEVGCSTGFFLHAIEPMVAEVRGVEMSLQRAAFARSRGLEVVTGRLEDAGLPKGHFDAIFLFQVFEHLTRPLEFTSVMSEYLAPGGTVYIEVPNVDDALLGAYAIGSYSEFYWRAPHAYYYSASTLERMLGLGGFTGSIGYSQEYSLFNHAQWLVNGAPQRSVTDARGVPYWLPQRGHEDRSEALRRFLADADRRYRALLEDVGAAQNVSFEGRLASS